MGEKFWEDETDPAELHRRADDLDLDGFHGMAKFLRQRARIVAFENLERIASANQEGIK